MQSARIMVADDEPNLRRVLRAIITRDGYQVVTAENGEQALAKLNDNISVVITDLRMPKVDGMAVLKCVSQQRPEVPVIMITAFGSVDNAVAAVKAGAFDYIEKPFEQEQIRLIIDKAVKQAQANKKAPSAGLASKREDPQLPGQFGLIGNSRSMMKIYDIIHKVADTPSTVLITGESGTGKELVAKALHETSSRINAPFIKINCAAIPKNLMESELFGYEKGAFTGATSAKPGRFELADGGTLFLDEIGEIPVEMQVKLLRAIQESEFERVGGLRTLKVDVRLITATNRDLEAEVKAGKFRDDLYYRLNVVPLSLPPLREREKDIPNLVHFIIHKFNQRLGKEVQDIDDNAMALLCAHHWPGNIRELENVIERTILFGASSRICLDDLPPELSSKAPSASSASESSEPLEVDGEISLKDIVRAETNRVERELIAKALEETGGNVTQAAKLLKISRKSLQMKMKDFGLRE